MVENYLYIERLNLYSDLLYRVNQYVEGLIQNLNTSEERADFPLHCWKGIAASDLLRCFDPFDPNLDKWTTRKIGTALRDLGAGPVLKVKNKERKNVSLWSIEKLRKICIEWLSAQGDRRGDMPELLPPPERLEAPSDKDYRDNTITFDAPYNSGIRSNITSNSLVDVISDIFLKLPTDVEVAEESYWREFCAGANLPSLIELSIRLLKIADYDPATHCLTLDHAINNSGYPNATSGLLNRLQDDDPILVYDASLDQMIPLSMEHLPCLSLTRLIGIASHPLAPWRWTRGKENTALDDDDTVAHHKCRNRKCINPLHLLPVAQDVHRDIHRAAQDEMPGLPASLHL